MRRRMIDFRTSASMRATERVATLAAEARSSLEQLATLNRHRTKASLALQVQEYLNEVSHPDYHRRAFGFLPANKSPPPLPKALKSLNSSDVARMVTQINEKLARQKGESGHDGRSIVKSRLKSTAEATKVLIQAMSATSSDSLRVVSDVMELYEANKALNRNEDNIAIANLRVDSAALDAACLVHANASLNKILEIDLELRRASKEAAQASRSFQEAAGERRPGMGKSSELLAKEHAEEAALIQTMVAKVESQIGRLPFGRDIAAYAETQEPLGTSPQSDKSSETVHAGMRQSMDMVAKTMLTDAHMFVQMESIVDTMEMVTARAKLESDIDAFLEQRPGSERTRSILGGDLGIEMDPTRFVRFALGIGAAAPGPKQSRTMNVDTDRLLDEMDLVRRRIGVIALGSKDHRNLPQVRDAVDQCLAAIRLVRADCPRIDIEFPQNPTAVDFVALARSIEAAPARAEEMRQGLAPTAPPTPTAEQQEMRI